MCALPRVAYIICAYVVVVAIGIGDAARLSGYLRMLALIRRTEIKGAEDVVIAIMWRMLTDSINAEINGASVIVITINRSMQTITRLAGINCAGIEIIAVSR